MNRARSTTRMGPRRTARRRAREGGRGRARSIERCRRYARERLRARRARGVAPRRDRSRRVESCEKTVNLRFAKRARTSESSGCALPENTLSLSLWGMVEKSSGADADVKGGLPARAVFTVRLFSASRLPGLLANTLSFDTVASTFKPWRAPRAGRTRGSLAADAARRDDSEPRALPTRAGTENDMAAIARGVHLEGGGAVAATNCGPMAHHAAFSTCEKENRRERRREHVTLLREDVVVPRCAPAQTHARGPPSHAARDSSHREPEGGSDGRRSRRRFPRRPRGAPRRAPRDG